MRLLICFLSLIVLSACSVYKGRHLAGHPDQDQEVADLRQLFRDGRMPKKEDIPLDIDIGCDVYASKKDKRSTEHIPDIFHFEGLRRIYNKGASKRHRHRYVNYFNKKGMQGKFRTKKHEFTITTRLVKDEDAMIVEMAFKGINGGKVDKKKHIKSDAARGYYVTHYMYCPLGFD